MPLKRQTRELVKSPQSFLRTVGSVSGTLKPRGRGARPRAGLKISAMIAATAAAATVGAALVIGPGGAAAAGPVALAMHWQRVTRAARRAAAVRPQAVSQGQAGNGPGRARGAPAGISVGPAPVTGPGSESPGRSARRAL